MNTTEPSAENSARPLSWAATGLIVALAIILGVSLVFGLMRIRRWAEQSRERNEQRWANAHNVEFFNMVKAGDDGSRIHVRGPILIKMLASDPDCVANLTTLRVDMADLSGPETASASKLVNVEKVSLYDCSGAENLLTAMKGSAAVEEISFDTTGLSDDGIKLLATFPNLKRIHFAYIREPAQARLLRETLPKVEIQVDEVGDGPR